MGFGDENPQAAWLDTWDALLWLVAFVVIEMNVFGVRDAGKPPHRARLAHSR
jgi:hypothetical protein